jgi:hypothetical protein
MKGLGNNTAPKPMVAFTVLLAFQPEACDGAPPLELSTRTRLYQIGTALRLAFKWL